MTFESKKSLALQYFPFLTPHSAVNKLMSLITDNQRLLARLQEAGYVQSQRHFTPLQVEEIYREFGRP